MSFSNGFSKPEAWTQMRETEPKVSRKARWAPDDGISEYIYQVLAGITQPALADLLMLVVALRTTAAHHTDYRVHRLNGLRTPLAPAITVHCAAPRKRAIRVAGCEIFSNRQSAT